MEEITRDGEGISPASNATAASSPGDTKNALGSAEATKPTTSSAQSGKPASPKHWKSATFVTVLGGIALAAVIYMVPDPARTFVALAASAAVLVVGGLVTLIVLIPAAGSNPEVKTEFLSARAAYFCVIAGLILFGVVAIGAVLARVILTVGGHF